MNKELKNLNDDLEVIVLSLERNIREIQSIRSSLEALIKDEDD